MSSAPVGVRSTRAIMLEVMLALLPGSVLAVLLLGPGVLINILTACLFACGFEALALALRRRTVGRTLADGSIVLAAWLLALAVPPTLPLSLLLIGTAAMTLLGKHLYGGLGHNPFNPAMLGYAVLLISFPQPMTTWIDPALTDRLTLDALMQVKLDARTAALPDFQALTGATPLDRLRHLELGGAASAPIDAGQLIREDPRLLVNLGFLAGGLLLLWRGVIRWHIPVALIATLGLLHALDRMLGGVTEPPVHLSLLSGGAMLGAFFVATDPVSAATSNGGRLLFAAGIGALSFTLREHGGYPEGIAFAVLIMNAAVPLIDRLTVPGAP